LQGRHRQILGRFTCVQEGKEKEKDRELS